MQTYIRKTCFLPRGFFGRLFLLFFFLQVGRTSSQNWKDFLVFFLCLTSDPDFKFCWQNSFPSYRKNYLMLVFRYNRHINLKEMNFLEFHIRQYRVASTNLCSKGSTAKHRRQKHRLAIKWPTESIARIILEFFRD
jgi:hypothetical protein